MTLPADVKQPLRGQVQGPVPELGQPQPINTDGGEWTEEEI